MAITGWNLLNQPADDSSQKVGPGTLEDALQHAFFPLTLPLTVGPGAISIAITLGAHLRYQAGPGIEHGYPRHFIAAAGGMLLVCFLVVVCCGIAVRLVRIAGRIGHKYSDAPLCLYPSSDRHPDSMDWLACRHPANARARCALRFVILRRFRNSIGGQRIRMERGFALGE